jgi:hypothetical protein
MNLPNAGLPKKPFTSTGMKWKSNERTPNILMGIFEPWLTYFFLPFFGRMKLIKEKLKILQPHLEELSKHMCVPFLRGQTCSIG